MVAQGADLPASGAKVSVVERTDETFSISSFVKLSALSDRKRKIYLFVLGPFEQCIGKFVYAGIVAYGEAGKRYFLVSRQLGALFCKLVEHRGGFLAHGTAYESRLTEAAAADTAAEHLKRDSVVNGLDKRYLGIDRHERGCSRRTIRFVTFDGTSGYFGSRREIEPLSLYSTS